MIGHLGVSTCDIRSGAMERVALHRSWRSNRLVCWPISKPCANWFVNHVNQQLELIPAYAAKRGLFIVPVEQFCKNCPTGGRRMLTNYLSRFLVRSSHSTLLYPEDIGSLRSGAIRCSGKRRCRRQRDPDEHNLRPN